MARTKSGYAASRANRMAALIVERLTGEPQDTYQTPAMLRGQEMEPVARAAYEFRHDVEVRMCGLFRHPTIPGSHASPDGMVGTDGLFEAKNPNTATHIQTLLSGKFDNKYVLQCQWQMACTGRKWVDLVSHDDRLPDRLRIFVCRIERDDKLISDMESEVRKFLAEVEEKIEALEKVAA
jgi:predicted phage-related endonuclease